MTEEKPVFPAQILTEETFLQQFAALDRADGSSHAAHANVERRKAPRLPDPGAQSIPKTHGAIDLPYDSFAEFGATGADVRVKSRNKA